MGGWNDRFGPRRAFFLLAGRVNVCALHSRTPTSSNSRRAMGILERSQSPPSLPRGARVGDGQVEIAAVHRPSFCGGSSRARAAYAASRTKRTVAQQYGLALAHHKTVRHYSLDGYHISASYLLRHPSIYPRSRLSNAALLNPAKCPTTLLLHTCNAHAAPFGITEYVTNNTTLDLLNSDHPPAAAPCPCGTCLRDILA